MRGLGLAGFVCAVAFCAAVPSKLAYCDDGSSPAARSETTDEIAFVLAGVVDSRQQLRSGVFSAKGTLNQKSAKVDPVNDGPITVFCAFDWETGRFRFDTKEPVPGVIHRRQPAELGGQSEGEYVADKGVHLTEFKLARTTEHATTWQRRAADVWGNILIHPSDKAVKWRDVFDVRTLGLVYPASFKRGRSWDEVAAMYEHADSIATIGNGVSRLTWKSDATERVLDVDTENGFTPIRLEVYETRFREKGFSSPTNVSETTWRNINRVWVPQQFSIANSDPMRDRSWSYQIEIDWESVNGPVDDELFSYRAFEGVPNGTPVFDHRRHPPLLIEKIGYKSIEHAKTLPDRRSASFWLITINISAILLIAIALVWKWYNNRASDSGGR